MIDPMPRPDLPMLRCRAPVCGRGWHSVSDGACLVVDLYGSGETRRIPVCAPEPEPAVVDFDQRWRVL